MKKTKLVFLFFILFFISYTSVYAIPFLGVIPFIFEIGVLIYAFAGIAISSAIMFLLQLKMYLLYSIFVFNILCAVIIFIYYSEGQFTNITLAFTSGNFSYIYILFLYICLSGLILVVGKIGNLYIKKILYVLALFISGFIFVINVSLLYDSWKLESYLKVFEETLNDYSNESLEYGSDLIRNNIFVSRDYFYSYQGENLVCRITLSYYIYEGKPFQTYGRKNDVLQFYTGLDEGTCREILTPLYFDIIQSN